MKYPSVKNVTHKNNALVLRTQPVSVESMEQNAGDGKWRGARVSALWLEISWNPNLGQKCKWVWWVSYKGPVLLLLKSITRFPGLSAFLHIPDTLKLGARAKGCWKQWEGSPMAMNGSCGCSVPLKSQAAYLGGWMGIDVPDFKKVGLSFGTLSRSPQIKKDINIINRNIIWCDVSIPLSLPHWLTSVQCRQITSLPLLNEGHS